MILFDSVYEDEVQYFTQEARAHYHYELMTFKDGFCEK